MTETQLKKLLNNPHTRTLVEYVDSMKRTTKKMISPQFFHTSHNEKDRQMICNLIEHYYDYKVKITRHGKDAVIIDF